jgi:hypothetical protein
MWAAWSTASTSQPEIAHRPPYASMSRRRKVSRTSQRTANRHRRTVPSTEIYSSGSQPPG